MQNYVTHLANPTWNHSSLVVASLWLVPDVRMRETERSSSVAGHGKLLRGRQPHGLLVLLCLRLRKVWNACSQSAVVWIIWIFNKNQVIEQIYILEQNFLTRPGTGTGRPFYRDLKYYWDLIIYKIEKDVIYWN